MPQMYPMNWMLFSFLIILLIFSSNNNYMYMKTTPKNFLKKVFSKNMKWNW